MKTTKRINPIKEGEAGGGLVVESMTASPKGIALMAAVEAGLLPEAVDDDGNEGWNTEKFEIFWSEFSRHVVITPLATTKKFLKKRSGERTD